MKNIFVLESQIYSSLSHPKRLEILHLLSQEELSVGQIAKMTDLSQVAVSQHLMTLKKLQLVTSIRHGQQRFYSCSSTHIGKIFDSSRSLLLSRFGVQEIERLNQLRIHVDPVCHMEVTAKGAAASTVFENKRYYFCALGCKKRFGKSPAHFVGTTDPELFNKKG